MSDSRHGSGSSGDRASLHSNALGLQTPGDDGATGRMPTNQTNPPPQGASGQRVGGGGGLAQGLVSDCLPLAAPIGLSPLLILTLCGPERVLVVSPGGGGGGGILI